MKLQKDLFLNIENLDFQFLEIKEFLVFSLLDFSKYHLIKRLESVKGACYSSLTKLFFYSIFTKTSYFFNYLVPSKIFFLRDFLLTLYAFYDPFIWLCIVDKVWYASYFNNVDSDGFITFYIVSWNLLISNYFNILTIVAFKIVF